MSGHFGLSMDGLEAGITAAVVETRKKFQPCTYLEIGVACGVTLVQVSKLMQAGGDGWRTIGVELPEGYSYNRESVERNALAHHLTVTFIRPNGSRPVSPTWNRESVVLVDSRDFFDGIWFEPVHIALIDGCHCKECVIRDFTNIEKFVPAGGIVMLHDYEERINDPQPHGGCCNVVGACEELGLKSGTRTGWAKPVVLNANPQLGGANMLLVTKE